MENVGKVVALFWESNVGIFVSLLLVGWRALLF
jgi:hypothetical protein